MWARTVQLGLAADHRGNQGLYLDYTLAPDSFPDSPDKRPVSLTSWDFQGKKEQVDITNHSAIWLSGRGTDPGLP